MVSVTMPGRAIGELRTFEINAPSEATPVPTKLKICSPIMEAEAKRLSEEEMVAIIFIV